MDAAVSDNPLDNSLDNLIDNLSGNSMDNSLGNPTLLDLGDGTGNISSTSSTSSLFSSCGSPQLVSFHVPTSGEIQSAASDKISHSRVC